LARSGALLDEAIRLSPRLSRRKQHQGSKTTPRDRYGYKLGSYDSDTNLTRDTYGNVVGKGDLLTSLLK